MYIHLRPIHLGHRVWFQTLEIETGVPNELDGGVDIRELRYPE